MLEVCDDCKVDDDDDDELYAVEIQSRWGAMCVARMLLVTLTSLLSCCCVNSFIAGVLKNGCAFVNYGLLAPSIFLLPTICVGRGASSTKSISCGRLSIFIFCRLIPFLFLRDFHPSTVAVVEPVLKIFRIDFAGLD